MGELFCANIETPGHKSFCGRGFSRLLTAPCVSPLRIPECKQVTLRFLVLMQVTVRQALVAAHFDSSPGLRQSRDSNICRNLAFPVHALDKILIVSYYVTSGNLR